MEAYYEDATTFKALFKDDTKKAMRVDIVSGATIGSASNPQLKFDFNKVTLRDWGRSDENAELITQTSTFKALYKISEAKMVEAVLTNLTASY